MPRLWYLCFLTLSFAGVGYSANILAILPVHLSSHFPVFRTILEALVERGHQVDVLSHFPRDKPLPGYTDFSVRGSAQFVTNAQLTSVKSSGLFKVYQFMYDTIGTPLCEAVMKSKAAKDLMRSKKKYDLVMFEMSMAECILGYVQIFKAPTVGVTTSVNFPWSSDFVGLPDNPSYIPNFYMSYTEDMNFFERLHNAFTLLKAKFWYHYIALEESNKFIQKTFGKSDLHVRDILNNVSLLMVNSHFSIQQSRPIPGNFIEIGGIHIKPNQTLPQQFEKHLETDLDGVVLLSFGTYFKSGTFPEKYVVALFEALQEIPYKVLWKGSKSDIPQHLVVPENVHFIPWLPQVEILCHPNLKFFISHCGLASIQETVHCGKPVLGVPVWADQLTNANTAVSKGIGVAVPLFELTKDKLSKALKELIQNKRYETNVRKLSEQFRDRPMSALDSAVYWTEYVIKYKGAPHLRPKGADLPWYTYYCVDIIGFTTGVLLLLLMSTYKLFVVLKQKVHAYNWDKLLMPKGEKFD